MRHVFMIYELTCMRHVFMMPKSYVQLKATILLYKSYLLGTPYTNIVRLVS